MDDKIRNVGKFHYASSLVDGQLHSIIAPALSRFTDAFLMETPVDRK